MLSFVQAIARQERGWGTPTYSNPRNNPGDIEDGSFAQSHGALPPDGNRFAAWPTEEGGFEAEAELLKDDYAGLTISQAIKKYAPAVENDDDIYIQNVCGWTGLLPTTVLTPTIIGCSFPVTLTDADPE